MSKSNRLNVRTVGTVVEVWLWLCPQSGLAQAVPVTISTSCSTSYKVCALQVCLNVSGRPLIYPHIRSRPHSLRARSCAQQ